MSPRNSRVDVFRRDKRGLGLVDSPFMIFLAMIIIAFVAFMGVYLAKGLAETQRHASAIDCIERIYNTADLLSAGAPDSTRTIWINLPEGYEIDFNGNATLMDKKGIVGIPLHINGVGIQGTSLAGGKKYHLLLEYKTENSIQRVDVKDIT